MPSPRSDHATCAKCGRKGPGCYWESVYKVLVIDQASAEQQPAAPLIVEPGDLGLPVLCDGCEQRRRVFEDFANVPDLVRRVYGAETAEEAFRLMGVEFGRGEEPSRDNR